MRILLGVLKLGALAVALLAVAGVAAYLTVRVVTGKGSADVPELTGLSLSEAMVALDSRGLGLRLVEDDSAFDDTIPKDRILRQIPPAGSILKQDRRVRVILSQGRRDVFVPRVVGEQVAAAQVRVHESGLRLGDVVYVPNGLVPENVVMDQEPARMTSTEDERVNLLVSAGATAPGFVMPDLLGRPAREVRPILDRTGFRVRLEREVYDGIAEGIVVRQKPLAGYLVRLGDSISLWSSQSSRGPSVP